MSLLGRAFRAAPRTTEQRSWGGFTNPWAIPAPGDIGQISAAGVLVDDTNALAIPVFYRGVNLIAEAVSTTPLKAVTYGEHGVRIPVQNPPRQITSPFYGVSLLDGLGQLVSSLILRGNAYGIVTQRDPITSKPFEVFICSPDAVRVDWSKDGGRDYWVNSHLVDEDDMVHISAMQLPGAPVGIGVIEYMRNSLGLNVALEEVAGRFFKNGIQTSGIISTEEQLDPDNAKAVAQEFVARHAGVERAYLPIIMGGGAKYQQMSLSLDDAQFIQSRQFQQGEIATMLGVPPHLLGLVDKTTSWGTGIEVQSRAFVQYTLRVYYTRIVQAITSWLPAGMYAWFDTDEITQADTETRFKNWALAVNAGFFCIDDVRAREGMPPLPDGLGQIFRIPMQQIPASSQATTPTEPVDGPPPSDPNTGAT